jgi:hypothetical protein
MKMCQSSEIRNPKTGRCVKKSGKIGKELLRSRSRSRSRSPRRMHFSVEAPCKFDEIRDPKTGRCVKKSGKIGKEIMRSPRRARM